MKLSNKLVGLIFLLFVWLYIFVADGQIGFGMQCVNDDCFVSAGSSIQNMALSVLYIVALVYYKQTDSMQTGIERFSKVYKVVSFIIDVIVVTLVLSSFLAIPLLMQEFQESGVWQFQFERNYSRKFDGLLTGGAMLVAGIGIWQYYKIHKKYQKYTVGQYIVSIFK